MVPCLKDGDHYREWWGPGGNGVHYPSLERTLLQYRLQEFLGAEYLKSPNCQHWLRFVFDFPKLCAGLIKHPCRLNVAHGPSL